MKLNDDLSSFLDEETPPSKAPSPPKIIEDIDAERAFEKLKKAAHVRPWDQGKDGVRKPCMFIHLYCIIPF